MHERLVGWKAIATYLGVSDRTAMRWHEQWGLPVHHVQLGSRAAISALPFEIESWLASREGQEAQQQGRADADVDASSDVEVDEPCVPHRPTGDGQVVAAAGTFQPVQPSAGRRWSWRVVALGGVVALGLVPAGLAVLRNRSTGASERRSEAARAAGSIPASRPVGAGRVLFDVEVERAELFTVVEHDGGLATVSRREGPKLGLGPISGGQGVQLFVFVLAPGRADEPESARQVGRFELTAGVATAVGVPGSTLQVTWRPRSRTDGPSTATLVVREPCCLACGGSTVCGLGVQGPCGRCGEIPTGLGFAKTQRRP